MARDFQPVSGMETPRFAGIATFMRLPHVKPEDADDVDIGIIGVPWDGGTTNRPGPRQRFRYTAKKRHQLTVAWIAQQGKRTTSVGNV